jgi:hypothetical protein
MDIEAWIKETVKCCACEMSMKLSPHINMIQLGLMAEWKYPAAGNILTGQPCIEAMAIICDDCVKRKAKIRFAVEFEVNLKGVKYHSVEKLQKLPIFDKGG